MTQLFTLTKDKGTVFLSQKRMTFDDNKDTKMGNNDNDDEQYEVVLRASAQVNETQYKSSTRIPSIQVHNFINEYNNLLRSNISHKLRKRDRKREKRKADIANIRKRQLETPVEITGSKRGAGRRKRVRKILAERKRQDALNKLQQGQLSSSNVIT